MAKKLPRRTVLKAAGASLALPMLDAMAPAFAKEPNQPIPRRIIAINVDLGFMPEESGCSCCRMVACCFQAWEEKV